MIYFQRKQPLLIILSFFLYCIHCSSQKNDFNEKIDNNVIGISLINFEKQLYDNTKLNNVFKNVSIVGGGEATHGTREFSLLKIELFKYLVTKHNFKNFVLEASYGNCLAIDNYIKGNNNNLNPKDLLRNIGMWIHYNNEMLSLIEWMKEYNKQKSDSQKLSFDGIDVMDCRKTAEIAYGYINEKLTADNKLKYLSLLKHYSKRRIDKPSKKVLKNHLTLMTELKKTIHESNPELFQLCDSLLGSIAQYIKFQIKSDQDTRDSMMFDNINHIMRKSETSKLFVWAHNFHIKKDLISYTNKKSLGHFLKNTYGDKYYSLGFDFAIGKFIAFDVKERKLKEYTINETLKKSSAKLFFKSSHDCFFLDFISFENFDKYLASKTFFNRGIGSTFSPKMVEKVKFDEAYDGIFFVKKTNASTLLSKEKNISNIKL